MTRILERLLPLADLLLAPLVVPAGWLLKGVRRVGVRRLPLCRDLLIRIGVFPLRAHYYEPLFDHRRPRRPFSQERPLPGIAWNEEGQLAFLDRLTFAAELADLGRERGRGSEGAGDERRFAFHTGAFESGDAEYWYQLIRALKPRRIFEVGSGHSTLLAMRALRRNLAEDPGSRCEHICIEPYESPWLEGTGVSVIRRRIEEMEPSFFSALGAGDILFIDSSHVIRPQGDVLFLTLELLPTLRPGVIVHLHDIFSPRDYGERWLREEVRFWNEQYLLEAFLSHNRDWEVLGALNLLHHRHFERLRRVAPFLTPDREPGSFYLRRTAS